MDRTTKKKEHSRFSSPAYTRIAEDLRGRIRGGDWPTGTMLPSRRDLAREYHVALGTIERAVSDLLADGALRADNGRGTYVAPFQAEAPSNAPPRPVSVSRTLIVGILGVAPILQSGPDTGSA